MADATCSVCGHTLLGHMSEESAREYYGDTPIVCCMCHRKEFKPGDIVEVDVGEDPDCAELKKFNGLRGIIVRPLMCDEDLAGTFDYVISWDWTDDRLFDFLTEFQGKEDVRYILDPRVSAFWIKKASDNYTTSWRKRFFETMCKREEENKKI